MRRQDKAMAAPAELIEELRRAGCVAAEEEAEELWALAAGDLELLADLVGHRCSGTPLAWVTGSVQFGPLRLAVSAGVYVPRWQSLAMAERAARLVPPAGRSLDLFTGSGAVAALVRLRRPGAETFASDIDEIAVDCARRNGVDARVGELDRAVPGAWEASVDVLTAVVPYVPAGAIHLLDRDSRDHEPRRALDGGPGGLRWLEAVVGIAPRWLRRPAGTLLLELGADQADGLDPALGAAGLRRIGLGRDQEGDVRYLEAGWARS
jgi:release factor glutamine methyltransferase